MNSSDWQELCQTCELGSFIQADPIQGSEKVHRNWRLQTSIDVFFAISELSRQYSLLASEADGLRAIEKSKTLHCPKVIGQYQGVKWSCLIVEWIELTDSQKPTEQNFSDLAEKLATLHQHQEILFGWRQNNYLTSSPQSNVQLADWVSFWRSQRLLPQIKRARDQGLPLTLVADIEQIMTQLEAFFTSDTPSPALVHGNFCYDSLTLSADHGLIVTKPACYYGDPLIDIAFSQLEHRLPDYFYNAYWYHAKHHQQEEARIDVYQLYYRLHQFTQSTRLSLSPLRQLVQQILARLSA